MSYNNQDNDWYPHDKSYKPTPAFSGPCKEPEESKEDMLKKYANVEKELLECDIVTKITNFTEYENALWQLNKIKNEQ
jgi:hypothetical protein